MAQNLTTSFLIAARPKRLNWIELFNARSVKVRGADPNRKNFQVQWIIEKDDPDLKDMFAIATNLLQTVAANRKQLLTWKETALVNGVETQVEKRLVPHKDYHWPFMAGEAHIDRTRQSAARAAREWKPEYEQHCADKVILYTSAPEAYPPILIIPVNGAFVQLDDPAARAAASNKFYRGMLALGKVAFMAYDTSQTSWGVTAFVNEVVATGKGERIGGTQADVAAYGRPEITGVITNFNPNELPSTTW